MEELPGLLESGAHGAKSAITSRVAGAASGISFREAQRWYDIGSMGATSYPDSARLIVRPTALALPFKHTQHNGRNRIWVGLTEYVSRHREGMPVAEFRKMAREKSPYVQRHGDRDIELYLERNLIEIVPPVR
jgi:hypothetical protein